MLLRSLLFSIFILASWHHDGSSLYAAKRKRSDEKLDEKPQDAKSMNYPASKHVIVLWNHPPDHWVEEWECRPTNWQPIHNVTHLIKRGDSAIACILPDDADSPELTDAHLIEAFISCTLLESVTLTDCTLATDKVINVLLEKCKKLKSLTIK